jgi:RimJ/RimL family protein N-acetyltransferase
LTNQINYSVFGLQSDRLLFRKLVQDDFDACLPFFQNPESNRYWKGNSSEPVILATEWFDNQLWRYDNNKGGINVLIHRQTNQLIGWCGLIIQNVDGQEELEVSYSIMPSHWKLGYATEAAKTCIDFAFKNNLSDTLISIIHVNNIESTRVAIKNGLALERETTYHNNPVHIFRIKKSTESNNKFQ